MDSSSQIVNAIMPDDTAGELASALAAIAVRAGSIILACRQPGMEIARKHDATPVTVADRRAEESILAALSTDAAVVPVISEEAAAEGGVPETGACFFLVDPLDGTREFVAGRDEFTVNIALIEYGRPIAGVVYAPALGVLAAADAAGARESRLQVGESVSSAQWRPLRTRAVLPPTGPAALASRSHRDAETDAFLRARGVTEIQGIGSSLKFLVIARGEADLYPRFGRTMEWDTAAGHAVLAAAGGAVVTADGSELGYGKRREGYANPAFVAWGRLPREPAF